MTPHDPHRFEITDARPVWPGRVKLAVVIIMALIPIATALAHHVTK